MYTPNRRERRKLKKNKDSDIIENIKKGKEIHKQNLERQENLFHAQLENEEIQQMKGWKKLGYNDLDIQHLRKAWYTLRTKNKNTPKGDIKEARNTYKEIRKKYAQK